MKNRFKFVAIILAATLCIALGSCSKEADPILIKGDFVPEGEALMTAEEAQSRIEDPFEASLAASISKEALSSPEPADTVTRLRVSIPQRNISMKDLYPGAEDEIPYAKAFQVYYGYQLEGKWYDFPAENYAIKSLDGNTDGMYVMSGNHVVEIGPFVLLAFNDQSARGATLTDSLNTQPLKMEIKDLASSSTFIVYENALGFGTENYDYYIGPFGVWYFIALEKEAIPEDYSVSFAVGSFGTQTYTYDDIMDALNRK